VTPDGTLPEILNATRTPHAATLELAVPPRLRYFRGHFPARPMLPGVVQLGWAIGLAREQFGIGAAVEQLAELKFSRVITPGARLQLELEWSAEQRCLSFRFSERDVVCSRGQVLLA
jgi:3-hydroxymyristoyl/3-hydroxydecanoyl-(acyl carrier protein) dehydratase